MSFKYLPRDNVNFLLFSEIYTRLTQPKAKRRAFGILEAAISVYSKKGWDRVTLEMVAREAGGSRTTILHYFADAKELQMFAIKYVRLLHQKLTVAAIGKKQEPLEMLEAYIRASFSWVDQARPHALVWLSFLLASSNSKTYRSLNSEAVSVGTLRIVELLKLGAQRGQLKCFDFLCSAKSIQALIAGGLISYASEHFDDEGKQYIEYIVSSCLLIAGVSATPSKGTIRNE